MRIGIHGFIVAPDDSEGLYERLRLLLADAGLRGRIGAEWSKTVEPFTWQGTTEQTMPAYALKVESRRDPTAERRPPAGRRVDNRACSSTE